MIFNMNGGGGAGLNFSIVGNPQPENPSENTIWLNTDAEITGWTFSPTQPESPAGGHAWITIGTFTNVQFNAIKKNRIMVYPIAAKQYIAGAWVSVTAKIYQNGAWVEWLPVGALYYFGNQCVGTSGGWKARGWRYDKTYTGTVVPTVTYNDDHMEITVPNANTSGGAVEVVNDQDFTGVNGVTIDFEVPKVTGYKIMLIVIKRTATCMDDAVCSVELAGSNDGLVARKSVTLDTSSVSGAYDVAIRFSDHWSGSGNATMKVYSVIKK